MICGCGLYACIYKTIQVYVCDLWNWTWFRLTPPTGQPSSKNRNQFWFLSSHLISLLAVPFSHCFSPCCCSLYFALFKNGPTYIRFTFCSIRPCAHSTVSLSSPAVSPDVCRNSVLWIYSSDRVYMASSGCHSAARMGPQFTMSIGSQVSTCQFHSWGGESCLNAAQLSVTLPLSHPLIFLQHSSLSALSCHPSMVSLDLH